MSTHAHRSFAVVGAAGRGRAFANTLRLLGVEVKAICDVDPAGLEQCADWYGTPDTFTDYAAMLDAARPDAVIIATPMPLHAEQSIAALQRDIHVLCEVPAAVSVDECRRLVHAAARSKAVYMMAENYIYRRNNAVVRELVRQGCFGEVYYAEGEYLHELRRLNEKTPWRRVWQTGIAGITYGTHSLGPILQWMPGHRVTRVACTDAAYRYTDPAGKPYAQTTPVMLAQTDRGGLIKIRIDMVSHRPHAMTNYLLQGSDGAYESARSDSLDRDRIWLRSISATPAWHDLESLLLTDAFAQRHLPRAWREASAEVRAAGHGGGDYFELLEFVAALGGDSPPTIGIHEAMDMTLPGLMSQESARANGQWLDVPDSRAWVGDDLPRSKLRMTWPRSAPAPAVDVPGGYRLRQFQSDDTEAYVRLMLAAGFENWNADRVRGLHYTVVPGCFFVIECMSSGKLVATTLGLHAPRPEFPCAAELGWVAADARHSGKGLGRAVVAAVTRRLLDAGYDTIYLLTDDHRLPALRIYLQLGFVPWLDEPDMPDRWRNIRDRLNLPAC